MLVRKPAKCYSSDLTAEKKCSSNKLFATELSPGVPVLKLQGTPVATNSESKGVGPFASSSGFPSEVMNQSTPVGFQSNKIWANHFLLNILLQGFEPHSIFDTPSSIAFCANRERGRHQLVESFLFFVFIELNYYEIISILFCPGNIFCVFLFLFNFGYLLGKHTMQKLPLQFFCDSPIILVNQESICEIVHLSFS